MVDRTGMLTIRISEGERDMLRELAEHQGVTASDVLRMFIRREHASTFAAEKAWSKLRAQKTQRAKRRA